MSANEWDKFRNRNTGEYIKEQANNVADFVEDASNSYRQSYAGLKRMVGYEPSHTEQLSQDNSKRNYDGALRSAANMAGTYAFAAPASYIIPELMKATTLGDVQIGKQAYVLPELVSLAMAGAIPLVANEGRARNEHRQQTPEEIARQLLVLGGANTLQLKTNTPGTLNALGNALEKYKGSNNIANASPRHTMPEWGEHNRE